MRKILLVLMLLLPWSRVANADNITQEKAHETAAAFFRMSGSAGMSHMSAPSLRMILTSEDIHGSNTKASAGPAFYVFDNASGPGFVIIAGDDAVLPVLGYSFENEFPDGSVLPPNLIAWLDGVRSEIAAVRADGVQASVETMKAWSDLTSGNPVVDLETALWNQQEPYNLLCPKINGQPTYTGCTATALAIIMRYHRWPERGTGTLPGYTTSSYNYSVPAVTLGYEYDWDNMLMEYGTGYSDAEANAVATLMRDCGVLIESDYGPYGTSGTGAYSFDIPYPLAMHMGYDKGARYVERGYYGTGEWYDVIKDELDSSRPVLYTGYNSEGGHAFVLDGYTDDNYFSVNWGWGGMSNGYFLLDALDPGSQGAGGSSSGYNQWQGAVIGIQKDAGGEFVEDMRYSEYTGNNGYHYTGLSVDSPVEQNVPFTLHAGLFINASPLPIRVENIMFAVVDKDGNTVQVLDEARYNTELGVHYGWAQDLNNMVIREPLRPGYRIRGFFSTDNHPEYQVIGGSEGTVWDLVIFDESMTVEANTTLSYSKLDRVIRVVTLDGVTVTLTDAGGTAVETFTTDSSGTEVTVDVSSLSPGEYVLRLQKVADVKEVTLHI